MTVCLRARIGWRHHPASGF